MSAQLATTEGEQDSPDDAAPSETLSIAKDDAFHILQNARRRAVLRYLLTHDDQEQFHMRELAEEVGAWEHEVTFQELTSTQRQRVYIALYQNHLPKLDSHGIIEYNQNRGIVVPTPLMQVFAPYLEEGLHSADTDSVLTVTEDDASDSGLSAAVSTIFSR